jgi:pimeloyl-ACP methyl ester carboxylesterase
MRTQPRSQAVGVLAAFLAIAAVLAGCGGTAPGDTSSATSGGGIASTHQGSSAPASGATADPATADSTMIDVGGHRLYMNCEGSGSPTVVYVHGWVENAGYTPHLSALGIQDLLTDDYRVCLYDRRNVGGSETVDAVQTPADMLRDMETVLSAGGAKPPYILMAASFGGLVAYSYLSHHPDDVAGLVFIDAMFPDELGLDRYLPSQFRFSHYRHDDECCTPERIAQFDLIKGLQPYIGHEPHVPMIYLASTQEPRNKNDYRAPKYDARILDAQAAFVDRFSPGTLTWVEAPHFMEPVVPDRIAQAVRDVDHLSSSN